MDIILAIIVGVLLACVVDELLRRYHGYGIW